MSDSVELATAYISLVPSLKGAQGAISKELGGSGVGEQSGRDLGGGIVSGLKGALGPVAGIVAGVFGAKAIVDWGKDQYNALARIESINAQTESVIKSTGNSAGVSATQVESLAGKLEDLTGTEAESIQQGANLLLTFKNIKNGAGEGNDIFDQTVVAMTDMARAMGTDAQGGAIQLGKALNDPIAGIAALSRVGITFSDDQKAVITSLTESGNVMEAQKIILAELNSQFGGSGAAYAETTAGKVALLGHAWGTFGEQVVSVAMPAIGIIAGGLTAFLNGVLTPSVASFQAWAGNVIASFSGIEGGFSGILAAVGAMILAWITGGGLAEAVSGVLVARNEFISAFVGALPGIAAGLAAAIPGIVGALAAMLPSFVDTGVQLIIGLVQALVQTVPVLVGAVLGILPSLITTLLGMVPTLLSTALNLFLTLVTAVVQIVPQLITTIVALLPTLIASLVGMLPALITAALTLFLGLVQGLVTAIPLLLVSILQALPAIISTLLGMLPALIEAAFGLFFGLVFGLLDMLPDLITTLLTDVLPALLTALVQMIPMLLTTAVTVFFALVEGLTENVPQLIEAVLGMIPQVVGALIQAVPQLVDAGWRLIEGLIKGIVDNAPKILAAVQRSVTNVLPQFVKDALGIASPSKVFRQIGRWTSEGMAIGIEDGADRVEESAQSLVPSPTVPAFVAAGAAATSVAAAGSDRPIYADGIGLIGWIRELANGEAQMVWNERRDEAAIGFGNGTAR